MVNQTVIVVERGIVIRIFSTIPADEHIIEILDLDCAKQESSEAEDGMESRIEELTNDSEYREVLCL